MAYGLRRIIRVLDPTQSIRVLERRGFFENSVFSEQDIVNGKSPALLCESYNAYDPYKIASVAALIIKAAEYARKFLAKRKEKEKYWPKFLERISVARYAYMMWGGTRGERAEEETARELQRSIQRGTSPLNGVKVSSRAHWKDVDVLRSNSERMRMRGVLANVGFTEYHEPLRRLIAEEVRLTEERTNNVRKIIGRGTPYPRFFIPEASLDYLMNLSRLYMSLRKLCDTHVRVFFYSQEEASLRAWILGDEKVRFSVFQRWFPGVTDLVCTTSDTVSALEELESLGPGFVENIEKDTENVRKWAKERLDEVPKKERKLLPQTWKLFDIGWSLSAEDIARVEEEKSKAIAEELNALAMARRKQPR